MALDFPTATAESFFDAQFDWVADTFNLLIATSVYTYSDAHTFRSDITNEVAGTNYTAGGLALDNKTLSAANPAVATSDDEIIAQSGAGFADGRNYLVCKIRGGAATADEILCRGVAGADFGNVAGQLTMNVPTSFITVSV